jgi:hypothetical protein
MSSSKYWGQRPLGSETPARPASHAVASAGHDSPERRTDSQGAPTDSGHALLTTAEAAHLLRLSDRTLERFRVEGTGPRYVKAGPGKRARVLYRKEDLEAWLDGFRFKSTSEYVG